MRRDLLDYRLISRPNQVTKLTANWHLHSFPVLVHWESPLKGMQIPTALRSAGPGGHSCVLMLLFHPSIPPEKEMGKMEWLCSLLRTSLLKNKQAEVSLIWPIFNSGRRQLVLGQREWKRKWGSGTHTLRAAMLDGECATSEDGKVKGRLSIHGLWHFQRHRSTDARLPVAFLRFSWGRSDRLSPCLSRS